MRKITLTIPTVADAKALVANVKAKAQARRDLAQARSEALDALARELLRQKGGQS